MAELSAAGPLFLLACSPRADGNSDRAARLFGQGFGHSLREAWGEAAAIPGVGEPVLLRKHRVMPCVACDACGKIARSLAASSLGLEALAGAGPGALQPPFGCPLTREDESAVLLRSLAAAPVLCLVSPMYFYHLPARLKGLIDRFQCFWSMRRHKVGGWMPEGRRICHVILLGARERGEKLFAGSLLTLRYAFEPLGVSLAEPLPLYGLDGPDDLAARPADQDALREYGKEAARRYLAESSGSRRA
jgi:multimeric flavodoxin WrbA